MSTTNAAATTATAVDTSATATVICHLKFSFLFHRHYPSFVNSHPIPSTATSSTPIATASAGAAVPGTPFATPFGSGGVPFVIPLPLRLIPEHFAGSGDFEEYLDQFITTAWLSGWFSTTLDNRLH